MRIYSDGALTYVVRRGRYSDGSRVIERKNNPPPPRKIKPTITEPVKLEINHKPQEDA